MHYPGFVTYPLKGPRLQWSVHYCRGLTHFRHNLTTLEFDNRGSGVGG
jgi:hypothetical protein